MKRELEIRDQMEILESLIRASTDADDVYVWSKRLVKLMEELKELKQ